MCAAVPLVSPRLCLLSLVSPCLLILLALLLVLLAIVSANAILYELYSSFVYFDLL